MADEHGLRISQILLLYLDASQSLHIFSRFVVPRCLFCAMKLRLRSDQLLRKIVNPDDELCLTLRSRVNLEHSINKIARHANLIQNSAKICLLLCSAGPSRKIKAHQSGVKRLIQIARCLARAARSRPKIVRIARHQRPVLFKDQLHQMMILPACQAAIIHVNALCMPCINCHQSQANGQALIDKKFQPGIRLNF